MLSDVTNEKIKYVNCGENRELLIDEIIRIGILDVSGNPIAGCKERICELYKSQPLSQKEFGEKLNALFVPNGYNPVSLPADDHTPYKPFKIVYNNAGLQFMFRDRNDNIHLECIGWNEVARLTGRMIRRKEYFANESLLELRKVRERSER